MVYYLVMTEVKPPQDEYIDRLPADATVGFVFADLYIRGDALAGSMASAAGSNTSILSVEQKSYVMEYGDEASAAERAPEDEIARHVRTIRAGQRFRMRYLFSLVEEGRANETLSPQPLDAPISIGGFKGNETAYGKYYLDRQEDDVVCTVDHVVAATPEEELLGQHPYAHEEPYIGDMVYPLNTKMAQLDGDDRKKLRIVTTALDTGIIKAGMLHAGADFYEMFNIARPVPPEPAKSSLLRRILNW